MKTKVMIEKLATQLSAAVCVLALLCTAAVAQIGVEQGPRTTPNQNSGGGVGIGINIDVGATIRALRNLNKKDKTNEEIEVEKGALTQYAENPSSDMTQEQFVAMHIASFQAQVKRMSWQPGFSIFRQSPRSARYQQASTCKANGSFEASTLVEWSGANNGSKPPATGTRDVSEANISTWTNTGVSGGPIGVDTSRQTLVGSGNDPVIGALLQQVRPGGGSQSLRIGNASQMPMYGGELIAKSFVVAPSDSMVGFWYAAVLNYGGQDHGSGNPKFIVRVLNSTGTDISAGRVNLGGNTNVLTADVANPFFKVVGEIPGHAGPVVYKDWACATIDLSDLVGQSVTIEFITLDCFASGHWAYAYIDDFCSTCGQGDTGWTEVDTKTSTICGIGKICFDVTAPKAGTSTGQSVISLNIIQNGTLVKTLTSPTLPGDGKYCFPIDPSTIVGLDLTKGFDYSAKTDYFFGSTNVGSQVVGSKVDGQQAGKNNDYQIKCSDPPPPVCGLPGLPPCPTCGTATTPPCDVVCIPGMPGCRPLVIGVPVCLTPPCGLDKPQVNVGQEFKEPKVACVRKPKPDADAAPKPKPAAPKPKLQPKPQAGTAAQAAPSVAAAPATSTVSKPRPKPVAKPKPKIDADECD